VSTTTTGTRESRIRLRSCLSVIVELAGVTIRRVYSRISQP
jgi:hypothetical protein